jgi:hypothetical protein
VSGPVGVPSPRNPAPYPPPPACVVLPGVDVVKADLVRGQVEIGPGFCGVGPVIVTKTLDPEFGPQPPGWQLPGRRRVFVVDHKPELVLPPPRRAQGVELVLFDDMGGEAIGVGARCTLRVGEQVDFPVRLLEGLAYLQFGEPVPPGEDLARVLLHRVPQLYAGRVFEPVQAVAVTTHDPAFVEDAGSRPFLVCELPDQAPRKRADHRMVEIAFAPCPVGPGLLLQIQVLDPVALGRQHLPQVGGGGFDILQLLGAVLFDGLGHGFLPFAIWLDPT